MKKQIDNATCRINVILDSGAHLPRILFLSLIQTGCQATREATRNAKVHVVTTELYTLCMLSNVMLTIGTHFVALCVTRPMLHAVWMRPQQDTQLG